MSTRQATVYSDALPSTGQGPRCQLVVVEGPDQGRATRLGAGDIIVGTGSECELRLTDNRVSSRHMSVSSERSGERFVVRDLGSKNGVVYEGSLVSEATVPVGATLKLGKSFVRIQPISLPLQVEPSQSRRFGELVAESLAMREVFAVLELAAASDTTILLEGETGTGKELAARAIHEASARRKGPFVAVDCGALPESLLESELFGHVRGAFTGATGQRGGAFLRAHRGTIFLDELAGISATVQARLLRVIEERAVKPVGADDERKVDLRVVAASRDDLEVRVAKGEFRADLFYRLSVIRITLPPLRARREDIGAIAAELLRRRGLEPERVTGDNLDALVAHDWPGNVRELRNVIDRAIALTPGARSFSNLRLSVATDSGSAGAAGVDGMLPVRTDLAYAESKHAVLHVFERRYLADVLARCQGNISETARQTGLDRKHLRTLLRKHDLIPARDE
jgi:DNA-binding NtrC family response regulator